MFQAKSLLKLQFSDCSIGIVFGLQKRQTFVTAVFANHMFGWMCIWWPGYEDMAYMNIRWCGMEFPSDMAHEAMSLVRPFPTANAHVYAWSAPRNNNGKDPNQPFTVEAVQYSYLYICVSKFAPQFFMHQKIAMALIMSTWYSIAMAQPVHHWKLQHDQQRSSCGSSIQIPSAQHASLTATVAGANTANVTQAK